MANLNSYESAVLIPAYENVEGFKATMECVLSQHGVFQIVVVDDSKSNDIWDVCKYHFEALDLYYTDLKYIRRLHRPGFRVASAWNILWREADVGPDGILVLTNSHILMRGDWLSNHIQHHKQRDNICVLGPYHEGGWEAQSSDYMWDDAGRRGSEYTLLRCYSDSIRKKHIEAIGGWDESYDGEWGKEDVDLAYRLQRHGIQWVRGTNVSVVHLPHLPLEYGEARGVRNSEIFYSKFPELRPEE